MKNIRKLHPINGIILNSFIFIIYVMMFKILILQKLNNIADDKTEYLIKDRLSFQRFPGLALCGTVPEGFHIYSCNYAVTERRVNVVAMKNQLTAIKKRDYHFKYRIDSCNAVSFSEHRATAKQAFLWKCF